MNPVIPITTALPLLLLGMVFVPRLLKLLGILLAAMIAVVVLATAARTVREQPDCSTRALTASTTLAGTMSAYRATQRVERRRNVGATSSCVDGHFEVLVAVSGEKSPTGSVPLPANPVFTTYDPTGNGNLRQFDSERKLLEWINARTVPSSAGTVYLATERPLCASCAGVVTQFRASRPMITINVV